MSFEALWYSCYDREGNAPHCARLSRRPIGEQWAFAIDLAIEFAAGAAGYRPTSIAMTGEEYWYRPDSGWWLIPPRIVRRCKALVDAATRCELHRRRGRCSNREVVSRLQLWQETGHWRRIAAGIIPRHTPAELPRPSRGRKRSLARIVALREKFAVRLSQPRELSCYGRYECDNGHRWNEGDTCPVCGEYWV
jgi:hypothetical protein